MTAKILPFTGITKLPIPADKILEQAVGQLGDVIIAGYDKDGNEYFASSNPKLEEVLWLLRRFEHYLMTECDEIEQGGSDGA